MRWWKFIGLIGGASMTWSVAAFAEPLSAGEDRYATLRLVSIAYSELCLSRPYQAAVSRFGKRTGVNLRRIDAAIDVAIRKREGRDFNEKRALREIEEKAEMVFACIKKDFAADKLKTCNAWTALLDEVVKENPAPPPGRSGIMTLPF
jgi:hypothetical protein